MIHHHAWPGAPLALLSAALFGASTPMAKALLGATTPWMLAGILYLGSGIGLAAFHTTRGVLSGARPEAPLRRADIPRLAAVVMCGGVIGPVLLMIGLSTTEASAASLLLNLEGVLTLAIAWIVYRENVDLRIGLGAASILGGAVLLSWSGGSGGFGWGALAIAAACLAWAVDNNLTRGLSSADPVEIAMIKGLVAGSVNVCLAAVVGTSWPAPGVLALGAMLGLFGYGISLVLFVLALRHLGSARTGAYFSTAPWIGAVLGVAMFGEAVTWQLASAAMLMGVGTALHLLERHEHEHAHEAIEHEHAHVHDEHHRHAHAANDPTGEPHAHRHRHAAMVHRHPHYPDLHHRHPH
jgi:drug/metabolite transporter (DMT)-like permease